MRSIAILMGLFVGLFSIEALLGSVPVKAVRGELEIRVETSRVEGQIRYHHDFSKKHTLEVLVKGNTSVKVIGGVGDQAVTGRVASVGGGWQRWSLYSLRATSVLLEFQSAIAAGGVTREGVFLLGSLGWYPVVDEMHTLEISASMPQSWSAVTSGDRRNRQEGGGRAVETWSITQPQEALDFMAAPFSNQTFVHARAQGDLTISTHFLKPDSALSQQFLSRIPAFLDHYEREIGFYPYSGFAVVENYEETGYGMAGFTLLGPMVLRLPFIFTSSLPHEVLHNWWGNSVYVDYESGNWAEGLTTYMADHWQQELAGSAAEYRRATLAGYADYATGMSGGSDFPLREFRSRHSASTQAVGYGKAMMVFHMLKVRFGEDAFRRAMQVFYRDQIFKKASWDDLRLAFEGVTGLSLQAWMSQWLDQTGAANIQLAGVSKKKTANAWQACVELRETEGFEVHVPLRLKLADGGFVKELHHIEAVSQGGAQARARAKQVCSTVTSEPLSVAVDPEFDVFRSLEKAERPPSMSSALAAAEIAIVYESAQVSKGEADGFADSWRAVAEGGVSLRAVAPGEMVRLEKQVTVLLGNTSANRQIAKDVFAKYGTDIESHSLKLFGNVYGLPAHSFALVGQAPSGQIVVWIVASPNQPLADLGRRLTHYGKFGALVFEDVGRRGNLLKEVWPIVDSPLRRDF
ncbi:MAG: M1 family aminopeptidase [Bdellovibrionales bacterium]|jgi:hypothetical protein|nr:M1 family aminopeptidase [Bdellovibrionales bacterium]